MTLDLSHKIVLTEEELEQLPSASRVREAAQSYLQDHGVYFPPRPPRPPRNFVEESIPALSNTELIDAYSEMVAYSAYMGEQLAYVKSDEDVTKQRAKSVEAFLRNKAYTLGYKKESEVNAMAQIHPYMHDAVEEVQKAKLIVEIMSEAKGYYTKSAALLSRSIETRKMEYEQTHRNENIGQAPYQKQAPRGFGHRR